MYHFAIVTLIGLATLKVVQLITELVPGLDRIRTLVSLALGVTIAVALDYSMFDGFGVAVRESWMGTWATGLVIGALATAWNAVFGYLGSGEGTATDSAHKGRPRIAA